LNTLKNYDVKATFCLMGENVEKEIPVDLKLIKK